MSAAGKLGEADLQAIEARWAAATPGPWVLNCDRDVWHGIGPGGPIVQTARDVDAEAIAEAPQDIARLIAEVRRLQESRDEWRAAYLTMVRESAKRLNK